MIPTQSALDRGWLVPNPTKGLSLDRMVSLAASFDRDLSPNNSNNTCLLVAPALVQILPIVEPQNFKSDRAIPAKILTPHLRSNQRKLHR